MRKFLSVLLLLSAFVLPCSATQANPEAPKAVDFHEQLQKATLALYQRWPTGLAKNPFVTRFVCTATVVAGEPTHYLLLTAGHCISPKPQFGLEYFIAEKISDEPVLQSVELIKSANTRRYDYAVFLSHSPRTYPVIEVDTDNVPKIGEKLYNVNFGLGLTKQVTSGVVGSDVITREESAGGCENCVGRYMAEFGIAPGASGSAVVSEESHRIVGLVEAIFIGLANGTVVEPVGKNFDDFTIDDSVNQKALPVNPNAIDKEDEHMSKTMYRAWRALPLDQRKFYVVYAFLAVVLTTMVLWRRRLAKVYSGGYLKK